MSIIKEHKTIRNFSYSSGNVRLSFGLDVDNKLDLNDFRDLLKSAYEELNNYLEENK